MPRIAAVIALVVVVLAGCKSEPGSTTSPSAQASPIWAMFQETRSSWQLPSVDDATDVRYRLLEAPSFIELDRADGVLVTNPDRPMRLARYRVRFVVETDAGRREHEVIAQVMPVL
jgi:hypothetical protein